MTDRLSLGLSMEVELTETGSGWSSVGWTGMVMLVDRQLQPQFSILPDSQFMVGWCRMSHGRPRMISAWLFSRMNGLNNSWWVFSTHRVIGVF